MALPLTDIVCISAVRTPMGRFGGSLKEIPSYNLGGTAIKAAVERAGLTGDQIPRVAKIIAVADTFDAITTVRPYQQPMTFERARARVNELRAVALDADVVDAFNRACESGLIRLDRVPAADLEAAERAEAERTATSVPG